MKLDRALGKEASFAPPCSNLRSLGRKFTVLKKVLVKLLRLFGAPNRHLVSATVIRHPHNDPASGELCPLCHPVVTTLYARDNLPITECLEAGP